MPRIAFDLTGQEYDYSVENDGQEMVNWYVEESIAGSKSPKILRTRPGLKEATSYTGYTTSDYSGVTSLVEHKDILYGLLKQSAGNTYTLVKFTTVSGSSVVASVLSSSITFTGIAIGKMVVANDEIFILASTASSYIWEITGGSLSSISDGDFPSSVSDVTYQDGYFIVAETSTQKFWISNINDGTAWEALDFASATSDPDDLKACISDHNELWLFGSKSIEVWYNSGNATFPFEKRPGISLNVGINNAHKFTVARADNTLYWVGQAPDGGHAVYRADGYTPKIISTKAISRELRSIGENVYGAQYIQFEGTGFYVIFSTSVDALVYNINTNTWSKWATNTVGNDFLGRSFTYHNSNEQNSNTSQYIVGSNTDGKIYMMRDSIYEDGSGTSIPRLRISPRFQLNNQLITIDKLTLEMEGNLDSSGGTMRLNASRDGGYTFGANLDRSYGDSDIIKSRIKWDMLGQSRDWVFKFTTSDNLEATIVAAYIDYTIDGE